MNTEVAETTTAEVTTEASGGADATQAIAQDQSIGEDTAQAEVVKEAVPAYTPNFKYKVHGQEKEFDDWVRAAIKDQETEKKARELFTRSDGIEHIKQDREALSEENIGLKSELGEFHQSIEELRHFVRNDDLTSAWEKLGIAKEQVLRWALKEVQMAENPQLREQNEAQRRANLEMYQNRISSQTMAEQYDRAAGDLRQRELDFTMSRPEIQSIAESYDSRIGRSGAFVNEVINRGKFHWIANKVDMPVDQVIQEVIQIYGLGQAQGSNGTLPQGANGVVQGSRNKPVLPSIPSSGQSVVKKAPGKGLAGLRQTRAALAAQQGE